MSSACDPLAPLQRWIFYTQHEVMQLKRELHEQEVQATQKIQQQQLDSLQMQIREEGQRLTETIDAVTELFHKHEQTQNLLLRLLADFSALRVHSQPPNERFSDVPATQLLHE